MSFEPPRVILESDALIRTKFLVYMTSMSGETATPVSARLYLFEAGLERGVDPVLIVESAAPRAGFRHLLRPGALVPCLGLPPLLCDISVLPLYRRI